jgi:AcrR family transcriptional regulator
MTLVAPSTKEQIVRAAERLFAAHGLDGVSLRQIGAEAGNGNNSAVQYHFGSKESLVRAIFEYRMPRYHERLSFLIAERVPDDLRSWTDCVVRAMLEQAEIRDSSYLGFVAMLHQYQRQDIFEQLSEDVRIFTDSLYEQIAEHLAHIQEPLRTYRISQALVLILHAGADRERILRGDGTPLPFPVEANALVDGMVGFLGAPVSPESAEALRKAPADQLWKPVFLERISKSKARKRAR